MEPVVLILPLSGLFAAAAIWLGLRVLTRRPDGAGEGLATLTGLRLCCGALLVLVGFAILTAIVMLAVEGLPWMPW